MIIAIDPDTEKSGIAFYEPDKKELSVSNQLFYDLLTTLSSYKNKVSEVRVEAGYLNQKSNFHYSKNILTAQKIAGDVGACNQVSKMIHDYCIKAGIPAREIKPLAKVWKSGKISQKEMDILIESNGITVIGHLPKNQEARDAILIAVAGTGVSLSEAIKMKVK